MRRNLLGGLLSAVALLSPLTTSPAAAAPGQATMTMTITMQEFPCPQGNTCQAHVSVFFPELVVVHTSGTVSVAATFNGVVNYTDTGCVQSSGSGGGFLNPGLVTTGWIVAAGDQHAHPASVQFTSLSLTWQRHGLAFVLTVAIGYQLQSSGHIVLGGLNGTGPGVGMVATPDSALSCATGTPAATTMAVAGVVAGP